jgi:hypothetical protein
VTTPTGADYRVKAEHPRRGGPLRITDKAGTFLAKSGDRCDRIAPDLLASMIANGYVEYAPVDDKPRAAKPEKGDE